MIVSRRERLNLGLGSSMSLSLQNAKSRHERVFKRWLVCFDLLDRNACPGQLMFKSSVRRIGAPLHQKEPVTKPLYVHYGLIRSADVAQPALGLSQIRGPQYESFCIETGAQLGRRTYLAYLTLMNQRHSIAAFGFIQIRCCHKNRQTVGSKMSERVPEF